MSVQTSSPTSWAAALAALVLTTAAPCQAQVTWTGLSGGDFWSTALNWSPQMPPTNLDVVTFDGQDEAIQDRMRIVGGGDRLAAIE